MAVELRPVYQDRFGTEGNCWQACLATLLGLSLQELPDFVNEAEPTNHWVRNCASWLGDRGWQLLQLHVDPMYCTLGLQDSPVCIASGMSIRGFHHSCVWYEGKVLHDPHPENTGLVGKPTTWFVLLPKNPWAFSESP